MTQYSQAYYKLHRKAICESARRYKQKHKEAISAWAKTYYLKNKEKIRRRYVPKPRKLRVPNKFTVTCIICKGWLASKNGKLCSKCVHTIHWLIGISSTTVEENIAVVNFFGAKILHSIMIRRTLLSREEKTIKIVGKKLLRSMPKSLRKRSTTMQRYKKLVRTPERR